MRRVPLGGGGREALPTAHARQEALPRGQEALSASPMRREALSIPKGGNILHIFLSVLTTDC